MWPSSWIDSENGPDPSHIALDALFVALFWFGQNPEKNPSQRRGRYARGMPGWDISRTAFELGGEAGTDVGTNSSANP